MRTTNHKYTYMHTCIHYANIRIVSVVVSMTIYMHIYYKNIMSTNISIFEKKKSTSISYTKIFSPFDYNFMTRY